MDRENFEGEVASSLPGWKIVDFFEGGVKTNAVVEKDGYLLNVGFIPHTKQWEVFFIRMAPSLKDAVESFFAFRKEG